ncbi:DUF294 nucleotidyltransferase-like domain-containing protein [Halobacillus sp. A1]|uniref:DUF294 nucleotidyltransferase-like domain-containing protein n=1 Tax=Halobacillus sp. A1 TaxID=2880262 RepID=UPI0020A6BFDE|nr:DUF294 nucleotidyltransferase-like domain-containing protein [Halobacillus sp. A1]MCP3029864.1 DUF294 nucleotidyltransferase-like domain-containing protein [Halobacillus sp. A1]
MFSTYEELKQWRENTIRSVADDHLQLNAFHDQLMYQAATIAMDKIESEQGNPPAPFAFFVMGSAGRFEQSVWSDQDHGIVFDGDENVQHYFLELGEEISRGLATVGYEWCEGQVMASNPLWCRSVVSFQDQISEWLDEASWQSLRNFSIIIDSRVLYGKEELLERVKHEAYSRLENHPSLYARLVDNFEFIKKGVGVFGQLLPDQRQGMKGDIHLKETAYFPYVNALRILALRSGAMAAPTISRFEALKGKYPFIEEYEKDFRHLLEFRLRLRQGAENYEKVHLLPIDRLTKEEKQELKYLIRRGNQLFAKSKSIVRKELRL